MSLEQKIEQLTKAVEALTAFMQSQVVPAPVQHGPIITTMAPVAVAAPVQQAPANPYPNTPAVSMQPAPAPVATAPAMPAPPTFTPVSLTTDSA